MLSNAHMIVLRDIVRRGSPACKQPLPDLRKISEPYRQKAIDLGMMEPPLIDVRGDFLIPTSAGVRIVSDSYRA
jgi:hypothetical protein